MKKIITHLTLPLLALFCVTAASSEAQNQKRGATAADGTLETFIVASGTVTMDLDMPRVGGEPTKDSATQTLRFQAAENSFLPILVLNRELRGSKPGSINLIPGNAIKLPETLHNSFNNLVIAKGEADANYDLSVRDEKTGFVFFNIEGHNYDYDASQRTLQVSGGRLLLSEEFAQSLGRKADANAIVGNISIAANLRLIEVENVVNGEVKSAVLPANGARGEVGTTPGPDVIVGDIIGVEQAQSTTVNGYVGLGVGTTSCNAGVVNLNWFAMPQTDHPVIPQNLYRMSGGAGNNDRFEQIGQSWMKHAFTALTQNVCNLGCNGTGGSQLGSGCSDPYVASLNYSQTGIGSRAWVNPFTGVFPSTARDHTGHTHNAVSHRLLVAVNDLLPANNPGATYFAEGQYVTAHEYAWCNSHPGECNMYNNASYRQYTVSGTGTPFSFSPAAATQRTKPAINAWTGASFNQIEPAPGTDGIGTIAYKVTNPSPGVWHYEYAIYNQNIDRAIQSFRVPLGCGVTISNLGFRSPLNEPGSANDGTVSSAGISNTPWTVDQTSSAITWGSETFAANPNANALRWGTMFNFRFDSDRPPTTSSATIGFFKTGAPINVQIQSPTPCTPLAVASAVSRKTHTGVGVFDIDLTNGSGVESRAGDVSMVVTFSNNVVSGNAAVMAGSATVGAPTFSGRTMTINLSGVTDQQKITVALSNVTDEFSQTIANMNVSVSMLLGDVNSSKSVTSSDVGQSKLTVGAPLDANNFRADVNTSGGINTTDIGQIKAAVGHTAP